MATRRVLVWADSEDQAKRRLIGWKNEPGVKVEQVKGQWAVTADKKGT